MDDCLSSRLTVVLLTYNCAHRLTTILSELTALGVPIVAIDNASSDGTAALLRRHGGIEVLELETNIGAAARNVGVEHARTPYVAFCDDDGWYVRDGLVRATSGLDQFPALALINARILVGHDLRLDPISAEMADSPLPDKHAIPGHVLLGFMAGACVVRVSAYRAVGGYDPEFFMGGEEEALALKLVAAGWQLRFWPDVVMHHLPSQANAAGLRAFGMRNALWTRWMYRRPLDAILASATLLRERPKNRDWLVGVALALSGLPWVMRHRNPISVSLNRDLRLLDRHRRLFTDAHRSHRTGAEGSVSANARDGISRVGPALSQYGDHRTHR